MSNEALPGKTDFAIITILPEEFESVNKIFGLHDEIIAKRDGPLYRRGKISSHGRVYSVVATQSREKGNLAAGACTSDVLALWNPTCLLVVGIAGGVKGRDNLTLGDVVVSNDLKYYSFKKETEEGTKYRNILSSNPSPILITAYQSIGNEKWWEIVSVKKPGNDAREPKLVPGLILAGEVLQGNPSSEELNGLLEMYDKALAFEMESGGVGHTLWERSGQMNVAFMAVRGISDYCVEENNQQTRKEWTAYSSEASAAAALAIVRHTQLEALASSPLEQYRFDFSHQLTKKYPNPATEFAISFLSDDVVAPLVSDLLELARTDKRIVLQGAAGSGKSVAFGRIATDAARKGFIPIVLNLKNWDLKDSEKLSKSDLPYSDRLDLLFSVSVTDLNHNMIQGFPDDSTKILIVDALNEVYGDHNLRQIVETIEELLQKGAPRTCAILSDRLTDRIFLTDWTKVKLGLLTKSEVKDQVTRVFGEDEYEKISHQDVELLHVPYFLDYAIHSGSPRLKSQTSALASYFEKQVGLNARELIMVERDAFEMYRQYKSPSFEEKGFKELITTETYEKLVESGALRPSIAGRSQFDHQLKHDYLASRYLATDGNLWTSSAFDAITFQSNSVESISMILDFLTDTASGDRFLRLVYDWNLTATVACLANASKSSVKPFTKEVEAAILSHVAEKLFDPIEGTRTKSEFFLGRFAGHPLAEEFKSCKNLADVFTVIRRVDSQESWFENWRNLFTRPKEPPLSDEDIQKITSNDSIVGWTTSNVIKRSSLSKSDFQQLRSIYRTLENEESKGAIRWRVVHSIGAFDEIDNAELLLTALDKDPYPWVQYGAARSLVEIAARTKDPNRRDSIFTELEGRADVLQATVMEELGRAVCYHDPPIGWKSLGTRLLTKLRASQKNDSDRERWKRPIQEFEKFCSRENVR